MLDLKVINLWAGPGAGKSTTAAGLFSLMKALGHRVELVGEYAKDLTYQGDRKGIKNQLLVLAQQDARLRRLVGEVEWVITDSPLPLAILYADHAEYGEWLEDAAEGAFYRYDNFDFFVRRVKPYATFGRSQTESEALALGIQAMALFEDFRDETLSAVVDGDLQAPYAIAAHLGLLEGDCEE